MRFSKISKRFRKDYKKVKESKNKNLNKLNNTMNKLINCEELDKTYKDHKLKGKWKGYRDCHIEGDWVLIYKIEKNELNQEIITFHATDNHSNLFK